MPSTTNGVIWSAIERFSVQGVSFLLGIVIARLVTPGEYGLIAMLAIFMAIAQTFIDSGFGNALIQKKDRNEVDYSTVFYFNLIISILIYSILYFCAPIIAQFYNQPQLTSITRWVGLGLIFQGLSLVQRAKLTINIDFKTQAKISLIAVIISGVLGVFLAYKRFGVWALVTQSLVNSILNTILLWCFVRWVPRFVFSIQSFKQLFTFGSRLLLGGVLQTVYLNLYSLIIGKFYNSQDVGYYNRASSIAQYPSINICNIMLRAIYPVQCEHQNDKEWINISFKNYLTTVCFFVFPLMLLMCIIAKPLVTIVLTEKWAECSTLITIIGLGYTLFPLMVLNWQILNVFGRSDLSLKAEVIKKIVALLILFATLPFGLEWMCVGIIIYNILDVIIITRFSKQVIAVSFTEQLKILLPLIFISGVSAFLSCLWYFIKLSNGLYLILISFSFILAFIILCSLFKIKELKLVSTQFLKLKNRISK